MKAVILAGGLGTRLSEETGLRPKPMVEIGGKPILWHILKMYSTHGINDFIICCGYKGYVIKEYFANYFLHSSDVVIDLRNNQIEVVERKTEPWTITLVDTGEETQTGGRLRRITSHVDNEKDFCMTYGDGLSSLDLKKLISFHKRQKRIATVTAVQRPGRFGALEISRSSVEAFSEKPLGDGGWVNGGFFVLKPEALDGIRGDETIWELEPLSELATSNQLSAYKHKGFWKPMDTLRDRSELENLWNSGSAPWKVW